jgi:type IV secretion system protein VirB2
MSNAHQSATRYAGRFAVSTMARSVYRSCLRIAISGRTGRPHHAGPNAFAFFAHALGGFVTGLGPTAASAQSFADPAGSGPIVGAVSWLQGTLLGTVATVVAVIAVASVGFLMLTGRMNWRYGATVILGLFILFGAASIVGGIQQAAALGS